MDYFYYPKASPRPAPVEGKRNKKFGLTPWGKKWINVVEDKGDEGRLGRGRSYARAELVYDIKFNKGKIGAKVKGSRIYNVSAWMEPFSKDGWKRISAKLQNNKINGALLNNELPEDIDKYIGFPLINPDLQSNCSCPDWGDPCKHVAALYYVLADEIDKAPLILFALRGISKEMMESALLGSEKIDLKQLNSKKLKTKSSKAKSAKNIKNNKAKSIKYIKKINKKSITSKYK